MEVINGLKNKQKWYVWRCDYCGLDTLTSSFKMPSMCCNCRKAECKYVGSEYDKPR